MESKVGVFFFFASHLISFPKSGNSIIPLDLVVSPHEDGNIMNLKISENDGKIGRFPVFPAAEHALQDGAP